MRRIFLGLLLIATYFTFAQNNTVYIDPNYSGIETGTINQPFNSWSDISFSSNTTYLQKRGTSAQGCFEIIGKTNLKIGAYGTGKNPIITGVPGSETSIVVFGNANNYVIENITLVGHHPNSPTAGVYAWGNWTTNGNKKSYNITIRNCDISYCYNGIRIIPLQTDIDKVTVDGCTIHNIKEDGIFVDSCSGFTCKNSYIYKVNQDWHYVGHTMAMAPGDGIQMTGDCDNFLIENCIIDRRNTGLKFCLIHQDNVNGAFKNDGTIRDCLFYPPKDTIGAESAGGALYIFAGDSVLIERCKIIGRDRIYSAPGDGDVGGPVGELGFDYIDIRYCLFDSVAILRSNMHNEKLYFDNCTFTSNYNGTPLVLTGGTTYVKNSIIARGPNTGYNFGIGTVDNTLNYQGNLSTWDPNLGFTDSEHGEYHLTSDSPAVDNAINLGYPFDLDGTPVPQGNAPDIGCYEHIQSSGQAPIPDFYSSDTVIQYGSTVQFFDVSSNNPTDRVWIFSGGIPGISNKQNPSIQYLSSGSHDVLLIASNEYGSNTLTKYQYIEVSDPVFNPIAGFAANDTVLFVGDNVNFIDQSENNPTSWHWIFEGGAPSQSTLQNPTVVYNSPGLFNVKLYASNNSGSDTLVKNNFIAVYANSNPPISNFSVSDTVVTIGEIISFTDESNNVPNSWTWIFQQGYPNISNLQNPNITYNSIGEFYVALIAKNPFGQDIEIKSNLITVYDPTLPLVADFTANKIIEFPGSPVQFHDLTTNGAISWDWNFGNMMTSTERNPTVVFDNPGYYDISLTVTSEIGSNSVTKTEFIEILPNDDVVMFEDNFNDGDIYPAWSSINGNWNENNGYIHQYSFYYNNSYLNGSYAMIGSPEWQDYILSCDIKSTDNNGIGFVFNYQDEENMYMFIWRKSSNERKIIRWENGAPLVIAGDNVPFLYNNWYGTEISNISGNISLKINGIEIFNVTDNTFISGKAGLYCWANNGSYFDNFKVRRSRSEIELKAFLEGPFENSSMTTQLNTQGLIPLTQPYSGAPWYYNGIENVPSIPNPDISDWLLIEVRDAENAIAALPSTIVSRQAAFILNDGSIVGLDGSSNPGLDIEPENQLFAVVRHRNHLAVMSSTPLDYSDGTYSYNFTSSQNQAYGTNALKNLGNGKYGLFAGDFNGSGSINIFDKHFIWSPNVGKHGYFNADGNLDGWVDNLDKNELWYNNSVKSSQVPKLNLLEKEYNTNIEYY